MRLVTGGTATTLKQSAIEAGISPILPSLYKTSNMGTVDKTVASSSPKYSDDGVRRSMSTTSASGRVPATGVMTRHAPHTTYIDNNIDNSIITMEQLCTDLQDSKKTNKQTKKKKKKKKKEEAYRYNVCTNDLAGSDVLLGKAVKDPRARMKRKAVMKMEKIPIPPPPRKVMRPHCMTSPNAFSVPRLTAYTRP